MFNANQGTDMNTAPSPLIARAQRDEAGVAAVEFALIVPVLLALLLGATELIRYHNLDRHLQNGARAAAQIVASRVGADGKIGQWYMNHASADSASLMIPEIVNDGPGHWWERLKWDGAIVEFAPTVPGCVKGCTYEGKAKYVWGQYGCGAPAPSTSYGSAATVTVPPGLYGPADVIVIRYSYDFKPRFVSAIVPAISITHQAVMSAEASSKIIATSINPDDIKVCP